MLRMRPLAHVRVNRSAFPVAERRQNEIARLELLLADSAGEMGVAAGSLDSDHRESPSK
jgi:hypothetical protein